MPRPQVSALPDPVPPVTPAAVKSTACCAVQVSGLMTETAFEKPSVVKTSCVVGSTSISYTFSPTSIGDPTKRPSATRRLTTLERSQESVSVGDTAMCSSPSPSSIARAAARPPTGAPSTTRAETGNARESTQVLVMVLYPVITFARPSAIQIMWFAAS